MSVVFSQLRMYAGYHTINTRICILKIETIEFKIYRKLITVLANKKDQISTTTNSSQLVISRSGETCGS